MRPGIQLCWSRVQEISSRRGSFPLSLMHLWTNIRGSTFWKFLVANRCHSCLPFPQFFYHVFSWAEAVVRLILSYAITLPLRDLHRRLQIPLAGLPESLQSKAGCVCVCVFFNEFMFNFIILRKLTCGFMIIYYKYHILLFIVLLLCLLDF